jgi:hypothetical protein
VTHPIAFSFPGGRGCALHRAVVYSSWLLWRDALPEDPYTWDSLRRPQVHAIGKLAQQLQTLRREARPGWRVLQWWDPRHQAWTSGRRLMLDVGTPASYHRGASVQEVHDRLRQIEHLSCAVRSDRVLEVLLLRSGLRRLG